VEVFAATSGTVEPRRTRIVGDALKGLVLTLEGRGKSAPGE
jgi:hypothetical protein